MSARALLVIVTACACGFIFACGGSGSSKNTNQIPTSGSNVQAITVNLGPTGNYVNGAFTSVTLCVPGSSNCQTISGVLVDTGSVGLRILSSALTLPLPTQTGPNGNPVAECLPFIYTYTWGPVQSADIEMSGEKASSVPIQVLSDTTFPAPSQCTDSGLTPADTLQSLGSNGILGVGMFQQDCPGCASTNSYNVYFVCPSSPPCQPIAQPLAQQVQNPVSLFASDNNGVMIALPAVSSPEVTISGSLVFGIGTESNNSLGSASVYTLDSSGNLTTQFNGQSYPDSFIDSGSNGIFFLDSGTTGIPDCSGSSSGFYCPSSVQNFSATNVGGNGTTATVSYSVADADSLFSNNPSDSVFSQLAGPNPSSFDWGLPFFYGRNVFTAIDGKSTPQGDGPYWAY
jgi:hypothetical protein